MLTQEQNLILQTYYSTSFLVELKNNDFLSSDYFHKMNFSTSWLKNQMEVIGIDNQGILLMSLYAMLVVPKQLIYYDYKLQYEKIDDYIDDVKTSVHTTYARDQTKIEYIRHIRNAVSHARVEFSPGVSVTFRDENNRSEAFEVEIPLSKVGVFLMKLQEIHLQYIKDLQK